MTADARVSVHYEEPGASWWALLFGPIFSLVGLSVEFLSGKVFLWLWIGVAVVLSAFTALWVYARRTYAAVRVTDEELVQGSETVRVDRIAKVLEYSSWGKGSVKVRVLGGGLAVPRKYEEVPLRLDDGSVVLAWARDGEGMRAALRTVMEP